METEKKCPGCHCEERSDEAIPLSNPPSTWRLLPPNQARGKQRRVFPLLDQQMKYPTPTPAEKWDVIVVGAGPGGAAGLQALRRGGVPDAGPGKAGPAAGQGLLRDDYGTLGAGNHPGPFRPHSPGGVGSTPGAPGPPDSRPRRPPRGPGLGDAPGLAKRSGCLADPKGGSGRAWKSGIG